MKLSNVSKLVGTSALALSMAVLPGQMASATTQQPTDPGTTTQQPGTTQQVRDDGFDWGWLGLLGLIGLAGLAGGNRGDRDQDRGNTGATRYREPEETGRRF